MRKVHRKIAKYHPRRVRTRLIVGVSLLWIGMIVVGLVVLDASSGGKFMTTDAIQTVFGVPEEVAQDFVTRGGIQATLNGNLEEFLESKEGIGYDAEVKLVEEYGWTRQMIVDRYPTTAWKSPAKKLMAELKL